MRIDRIEIYHVSMPLVYPFRTAYGDEYSIQSVLVRMESEGTCGWGEATPGGAPIYSPEWAYGAYATMRDHLAPRLIGQEVPDGQTLQALLGAVKGNPFAKAGLDLAWWDLHARMLGKPMWQMVGGKGPEATVGADFGVMDTVDALLGEIEKAVKAGFRRVKLKLRPGWDVAMVAAVRDRFPDHVFHVDCNSSFSIDDAALFQRLDKYGLAMIEQPLANDDLVDHARLQAQIETAVCLDESITSAAKTRKAIEIGACRIINIKAGRVGGMTNALEIYRVAHEHNVPCWIGGMLESAIGQSHNLALATLDLGYPSDVFPSNRFYEPDLAAPGIEMSGPSVIRASDAPGIGCEPDARRLESQTLNRAEIA